MNAPVKSLPFCRWHLLILMSIYFCLPSGFSQDVVPVSQDTVETETIAFEEIPAAAGETVIRAKRMAEEVITEEQISSLETENDSIVRLISARLAEISEVELETAGKRYLNNLLGQAMSLNNTVENEKQNLSSIVATLNDKKGEIAEDKLLWLNTDEALSEEESAPAIEGFIDDAIFYLDSVNALTMSRSEEVLELLDRTIELGLKAEDEVNKLRSELSRRQKDIMRTTHPSLFAIDYADPYHWQLEEHFQLLYVTDLVPFTEYLKSTSDRLFYYLAFLVLLVALFFYFKSWIRGMELVSGSFYERMLKKILSKPVSAALILGLYISVLFFPNRPSIFTDITVLLVTVPLIVIFKTLSEKRLHKYIYIFGVLILLRFINIILPADIVLYRILTFLSAFIEILALLGLWGYFKKRDLRQKIFKGFVQLIILFHIITASIGAIADLAGALTLAEIAVNLTITNTLAGLLISISAIIVTGLLHLAIEGKQLRKLNLISKYGSYLKHRLAGLVSLIAVIIWFFTILRSVNVNDDFREFLGKIVDNEYNIGSASFTLGSIILFFFVIWLSVIVARIIKVVLEEDVLERFTLKKGVPRMISVMIRYTLITIGVFLAVSAAGMPLDSLTIIFGAFSVGIGFGLQNIFNNLVSGLILLFERPVQIGDTVEVGNLIGVVKSMGIRSSNIKTFDGAEVIVPNGHLISNEVINWTLSDKRRRIEILSGVAYGSDVHKVQQLFMKVLNEHRDIIQDPAPNVYFNDLGESSLDFRLLFWTDNFDEWLRIRSEVVFKVHDALYAEGIEIPFPQRDLHIRSTVEKK